MKCEDSQLAEKVREGLARTRSVIIACGSFEEAERKNNILKEEFTPSQMERIGYRILEIPVASFQKESQ